MKRSQPTINRALVREGAALAGNKWYRMPMAVLLGLSGATLMYLGFSSGDKYLVVIGCVFIVCALLSCIVVRRAEKTISKLQNDIEDIITAVDKAEDRTRLGD